jgi:hypothetical protein
MTLWGGIPEVLQKGFHFLARHDARFIAVKSDVFQLICVNMINVLHELTHRYQDQLDWRDGRTTKWTVVIALRARRKAGAAIEMPKHRHDSICGISLYVYVYSIHGARPLVAYFRFRREKRRIDNRYQKQRTLSIEYSSCRQGTHTHTHSIFEM